MKRWFFISIALIGLLFACDHSDGGKSGTVNNDQKTIIVFDNTKGTSTAIVYSSSFRTEDSKIAEIPPGKVSNEFGWTPGSSVPFYFSYNLNLTGINAFTFNYTPEVGRDQVYLRIDANKKNVITIPSLAQTISSPDTLLSNNSYLFIQNNSSFSISLTRGLIVLLSDNFSDIAVNPGERAQYTIRNTDSRDASMYKLTENGRIISFQSPNNFEPGRVYNYIYNGNSISLFSIIEIKLINITEGSSDDPGNKTWVRFVNNNDFSVNIYSDLLRRLKISDTVSNGQTNIQTEPNLGGALYYPTYNVVIDNISIPYNGTVIITRIDAGKTQEQPNLVYIPMLEELTASEFERPITNSVYIRIHNDANSSLSLRQGQSDLFPQGAMSSIVNSRETALYIVNPGAVSNYSVRKNTIEPLNFPDGLTDFAAGHLYSFRYDGARLLLLIERPLTFAQAFALSPPESIYARTLPSGSIVLNWTRAGTENSYGIYRAEENPEDLNSYSFLASAEHTSYTDSAVVLGNTYHYRLSSFKNSLESDKSKNYASALSQLSSLSSPSGLAAAAQGTGSILLSWNPVEDAIAYKIYQSLDSQNITSYLTTTASISHLVSGLESDTTYWFTVSAISEYSESFPSAPVNAITFDIPPEPVYYTVTFNSNGGSRISDQTVESGETATRPDNPTRSGYTFDNWYSNSALTTAYNFSSPVTGDLTLWAKWNHIAAGTMIAYHTEGISFNMAAVPGEITFPTGTNDTGRASISDSYQIGETAVTWELWNTVRTWAIAKGYSMSSGQRGSNGSGSDQQPITNVNWYDAMVWCNALTEYWNEKTGSTLETVYNSGGSPIRSSGNTSVLNSVSTSEHTRGFRLPTSNEWELAARWQGQTDGGNSILVNGYYYTKGDSASGASANSSTAVQSVSVYSSNSSNSTAPVKSKNANALGLYDMSGNVWEWCINTSSSYRVTRGGAYDNDSSYMRVGYVHTVDPPSLIDKSKSFRLVRSAPASSSNNRYEVVNQAMTWENAKLEAERRGGYLAVITSAQEQSTIESLVNRDGTMNNYWLGGYRNTNNTFVWITGEPMSYTNWYPGEPNNGLGGIENRIELSRYANWQWNDISQSDYFGFIIEWNDEPTLTIQLPGTNVWNFVNQNIQINENTNRQFSVTGTYSEYRWYIDGVQVGTASSFTFNKPAGVYELSLVVRNDAGESHSVSCTVTVLSIPVEREITVAMWDSRGDGWDTNAALRINVNGNNLSSQARLSSGGGPGYHRFMANAGDVVTFYWVNGGSYDYECAFAVYYSDDQPSPAFNPNSGSWSQANDPGRKVLIYKQFSSSGSVGNGTQMGSFTMPGSTSGGGEPSEPPGPSVPFSASTASEFTSALSTIQSSADTNFTINVTANLNLAPQNLTASSFANKTITIKGNTSSRKINLSSNGSLFTVGANERLVLEDIVLEGRSSNNTSLVKVNQNGKLVLNSGGKVTGNTYTTSTTNTGGAGILVDGGTLEISGGEVSGNTLSGTVREVGGGGIYTINSSTIIMNGGAIKNNALTSVFTPGDGNTFGGGIAVFGNSSFEMFDGVIEGNTNNGRSLSLGVGASGGGVYIRENCSFNLYNGKIRNNTCYSNSYSGWGGSFGGGVGNQGIFKMTGGIINGNTVSSSINPNSNSTYALGAFGGGVITDGSNARFEKTGGIIYGNEVTGNDSDGIPLKNTAQSNSSGLGGGHAVFFNVEGTSQKLRRNTTSNTTNNMNSSVSGSAGGWE